jgi:hypothetical protein
VDAGADRDGWGFHQASTPSDQAGLMTSMPWCAQPAMSCWSNVSTADTSSAITEFDCCREVDRVQAADLKRLDCRGNLKALLGYGAEAQSLEKLEREVSLGVPSRQTAQFQG